jgi:hypothetical protein
MLRTFDFAVKGAANKSAQGIALGGVGIAVRVTRRPRGAGRGSSEPGVTRRTRGARRGSRWARVSQPRPLARPPGLPHSSQTPVSEVFVLAKLTPKRRRPIGQAFGRGQETRAQRGRVPGWRTTNNCATSKLARRVGVEPSRSWVKEVLSVAERQPALRQSRSSSVAQRLGFSPTGNSRPTPRN